MKLEKNLRITGIILIKILQEIQIKILGEGEIVSIVGCEKNVTLNKETFQMT